MKRKRSRKERNSAEQRSGQCVESEREVGDKHDIRAANLLLPSRSRSLRRVAVGTVQVAGRKTVLTRNRVWESLWTGTVQVPGRRTVLTRNGSGRLRAVATGIFSAIYIPFRAGLH